MGRSTSHIGQTPSDTINFVTPDSSVSELSRFTKSTIKALESLKTFVNYKDIKRKISSHNSQDVKEQTSTLPSVPQDVKLIPDVLVSLYSSPNKYLIVEDVQTNVRRYMKNTSVNCDNLQYKKPKKLESNVFANYQRVPAGVKDRSKEKEKPEIEYFCKLPISRTEPDNHTIIYHLEQSFQCLVCHKALKASFNILENKKTMMIDEIKNDYLLPYQRGDVAGLVHRKCESQENLNCDDNHYRCGLLSEKELKNSMNIRRQIYMLIITMALIFPIFLNFLAYSLPYTWVSHCGIWGHYSALHVFIGLVSNKLFKYYRKPMKLGQYI